MKNNQKAKYNSFKQILNTFYNDEMAILNEPEKKVNDIYNKIQIIPTIIYNKQIGELKVRFELLKDKQSYKIENIKDFYDRINEKASYKYGTKLEFIHDEEAITKESKKILKFIMKYAEIIKYVNNSTNENFRKYGKYLNEEYININETALDELFEILKGKYVKIQTKYEEKEIMFVEDEPNIRFEIEKINDEEYKISPSIDTHNTYEILKGKKYTYFLYGRKLYKCTKQYENTIIKLLNIFRQNITNEMTFDEEYLKTFCSLIVPKMEKYIEIKDKKKLNLNKYIPEKLIAKTYLDIDNRGYITLDIKFCYGNIEFNPLNNKEKVKIPRNILNETEKLNIIRKSGFMYDSKNERFILTNNDKIYDFLVKDIEIYRKNFEVLVTENLKTKQIKQPKLSNIGVKISNNLLNERTNRNIKTI